jgi:hypothetical protein
MLRGLRCRPRAPASDERHQHFVRLAPGQNAAGVHRPLTSKNLIAGLAFFSTEKEKLKDNR